MLTAEELLAGSQLTFEVEVPVEVLRPSLDGFEPEHPETRRTVRLRPLTLSDLQTITRAAKESDSLIAALMVQQALVEPALNLAEVVAMHAGLVQFLLAQVNTISGISIQSQDLKSASDAPLARAAFILAREYGWTPQEVNDLTLGQVLLHLQMLEEQTA
jgi:hypothetical protein